MTMDLQQLELGGSKVIAPGSEPGLLMNPMKPSSTTVLTTKSTCALISTMVKSTQVDMLVIGTGKHGENVTI